MGAYKRDMVDVIKMGAYIHGMLILCGCLLSRFYSIASCTAYSEPPSHTSQLHVHTYIHTNTHPFLVFDEVQHLKISKVNCKLL